MVIRGRYSTDSSPPHQSKKIKTTHQFPEGIILEILARLPVKSLLRFRCVSKSWLSLISTPCFIKIHLQNSSKESSFHNRRVMVTSCYPSYSLKQCSALLLIHEPNTYAFNIDYPNKSTNQSVWVVGSCNGLVCIAISKKEWYLWNPSTKISKKLPSLDFIVKPTFHTFHNIYGFGYCESNDDYKVVGILSALGNAGVYESVVKVYSLRTNSWKRIEGFNFGVPLDNSGKFVAGKIHFSMIMGIVSLDLESDVYGKIEQPNYEEGSILEPSLGVLGGCISVLCNYNTRADVWVMKEYGVEESWTKVVSVPYFNDPETKKLFYSRPLCLLSTRELLLVIDSQFVVYDKKDNCLRLSNLGRFLEADIYVESLISPIPEN